MVRYEIDENHIRENIQTVLCRARVPVWAVIKFDGYGVGLCRMAGLLKEAGVPRFAVSETEDLITLRRNGFVTEEILLLGQPTKAEELRAAIQHRAVFSVGSLAFSQKLKTAAWEMGRKAQGHITVDTGMGRFGFLPSQYEELQTLYEESRFLTITGIYSHFYDAFQNEKATRRQYEIFANLLDKLHADGISRGMAHIMSSAALFKYSDMRLDAVRIGSAFLGRVCGMEAASHGLHKIGILKAGVSEVKSLPRGHHVGYGSDYKLFRDTDVAVIGMGHWAGVPELGLKARLFGLLPHITINGKQAPMVCAPGMGHTIADVTGLQIEPGDSAEIDVSPLRVSGSVRREYK